MEIIVIGDSKNQADSLKKFGEQHQYQCYSSMQEAVASFRPGAVIFDFKTKPSEIKPELFNDVAMEVFLNTPKTSLSRLGLGKGMTRFYGFNGLPGFFTSHVLEVTETEGSTGDASKVCEALGVDCAVVRDQVGMVTPRVICMIINEAYFTFQEGTASREDIDLAMKLGTNYPYGPFEWAAHIGIKHVYEVLQAIGRETGDVRYRICELLEKEYSEALAAM